MGHLKNIDAVKVIQCWLEGIYECQRQTGGSVRRWVTHLEDRGQGLVRGEI